MTPKEFLSDEKYPLSIQRPSVYEAMQEYADLQVNSIKSIQLYGNQRFNAALSEAIEKVMQLTQDRHRKNEPAIFYPSEVNSILEGLKIKP